MRFRTLLRIFCAHRERLSGWLRDPMMAPYGWGQTPGEKCRDCGHLFIGKRKVKSWD